MAPMLAEALEDTRVPDAARKRLEDQVKASVVWSLAQSGELVRLVGMLEAEGIESVALKGPLLSRYLYEDLATRTSGDIDLLLKPEDVPGALTCLETAGYRLQSWLHWDAPSASLRLRENEIHFDSPSGVAIDLHWRLAPPYYASPFDVLDPWDSVTTVELQGQQIRTLGPEALLLFLTSHGAKHLFERLGWIVDIARLVTVMPEMDWARVADTARRARSWRQLALGLRLAERRLGVGASAAVEDEEDEAGRDAVEALIREIEHRFDAGATGRPGAWESTRLGLRLLETPGSRLRYLRGLYITPSEADFEALRLPAALYPLYYFYRPVRLAFRGLLRRGD